MCAFDDKFLLDGFRARSVRYSLRAAVSGYSLCFCFVEDADCCDGFDFQRLCVGFRKNGGILL